MLVTKKSSILKLVKANKNFLLSWLPASGQKITSTGKGQKGLVIGLWVGNEKFQFQIATGLTTITHVERLRRVQLQARAFPAFILRTWSVDIT